MRISDGERAVNKLTLYILWVLAKGRAQLGVLSIPQAQCQPEVGGLNLSPEGEVRSDGSAVLTAAAATTTTTSVLKCVLPSVTSQASRARLLDLF